MKKILFVLMAIALLSVPTTAFAASYPVDDATAGTIIGYLAPVTDMVGEVAHGQAVINYTPGTDSFEVQLSVTGLEPNTQYSLFLYPSRDEWEFTTNAGGNGGLHLTADGFGYFDRINVRAPGEDHTAVLSTVVDGGSLRQVPSAR